MDDLIQRLEAWYDAQGEEDIDSSTPWQHRYGISISTSDNPAWNVGIDLCGTDMEGELPPK